MKSRSRPSPRRENNAACIWVKTVNAAQPLARSERMSKGVRSARSHKRVNIHTNKRGLFSSLSFTSKLLVLHEYNAI
jgi:hypothetical protein